MSNEEICITILITFGIFHIWDLIIRLSIMGNKVDRIEKMLKELMNAKER